MTLLPAARLAEIKERAAASQYIETQPERDRADLLAHIAAQDAVIADERKGRAEEQTYYENMLDETDAKLADLAEKLRQADAVEVQAAEAQSVFAELIDMGYTGASMRRVRAVYDELSAALNERHRQRQSEGGTGDTGKD